jgi:hypothetical protein
MPNLGVVIPDLTVVIPDLGVTMPDLTTLSFFLKETPSVALLITCCLFIGARCIE